MARRNETTSGNVASSAAKALKDPAASKREKSIAGSALTQREPLAHRAYVRKLERIERAFTALFVAIDDLRKSVVGKTRKAPLRAR